MSQEKELYKALRLNLFKMTDYLRFLEKNGSGDLIGDINLFKDQMKVMNYFCDAYLNYYELSHQIKLAKKIMKKNQTVLKKLSS